MVLSLEDSNGHVGKWIDGFEVIHGRNDFGERNVEGEMLQEFYNEKELCVANTLLTKNNTQI